MILTVFSLDREEVKNFWGMYKPYWDKCLQGYIFASECLVAFWVDKFCE